MATYAVGDIQGCHEEFLRLLDQVGFDPASDQLWLAGDLVNRGPDSLGVMRTVMALGDAVRTVLGNHDLHLMAVARGASKPRKRDTLDVLLESAECDAIIGWLRRQPLVLRDRDSALLLVHAGLPAEWSADDAETHADEIARVLADDDQLDEFLVAMYGNEPSRWSDELTGMERLRFITNCLTRLRFCAADGAIDLDEKGGPEQASAALQPWYAVTQRRSVDTRILFGHWSTLRLTPNEQQRYNVVPLDTGAVWGGELTACRIDDWRLFSVASASRAPLG